MFGFLESWGEQSVGGRARSEAGDDLLEHFARDRQRVGLPGGVLRFEERAEFRADFSFVVRARESVLRAEVFEPKTRERATAIDEAGAERSEFEGEGDDVFLRRALRHHRVDVADRLVKTFFIAGVEFVEMRLFRGVEEAFERRLVNAAFDVDAGEKMQAILFAEASVKVEVHDLPVGRSDPFEALSEMLRLRRGARASVLESFRMGELPLGDRLRERSRVEAFSENVRAEKRERFEWMKGVGARFLISFEIRSEFDVALVRRAEGLGCRAEVAVEVDVLFRRASPVFPAERVEAVDDPDADVFVERGLQLFVHEPKLSGAAETRFEAVNAAREDEERLGIRTWARNVKFVDEEVGIFRARDIEARDLRLRKSGFEGVCALEEPGARFTVRLRKHAGRVARFRFCDKPFL